MLRYVVFLRQKSRENQEYVDKFYATMQLRKSKLNIHSPMDQVFSVTEDYLINDMPWGRSWDISAYARHLLSHYWRLFCQLPLSGQLALPDCILWTASLNGMCIKYLGHTSSDTINSYTNVTVPYFRPLKYAWATLKVTSYL